MKRSELLHRNQHETAQFDILLMALSLGNIGTMDGDTLFGFCDPAFGLGEVQDCSVEAHKRLPSVIVLPGSQPHFYWAKSGEYVRQVTAIGPFGLSYVDPANDPRSQG
jgi:hypothetical protein